jgi:ribosome-associated toxin RatA of RatAB toxin-antitoxin module
MPKIEKSTTINAPVKKVFEYVSNAELMPEWLPGMVEVKNVNSTEEGVGSTYKWIYKMAGIRFEGESISEEYMPEKKMVTRSKGSINSLWTWNFEPQNNGTKIELVIDYTIPMPVLGKIAEAIVLKQNIREADLALANIKAKMES